MLRLWRGIMWGGPAPRPGDDDGDSDERQQGVDEHGGDDGDDDDDDDVRPSPRVPARLLVPGGVLAALSVAIFLGYGAIAPEVDRAVAGLVDTDAYVSAVLDGPDAMTDSTIGGRS